MSECIDHGFAGNKPQGYHQIRKEGKLKYVHRLVFAAKHGLEEKSLPIIRHLCNNPRCVNPEHLAAGTHQDNADDRVLSGRSAKTLPRKRKLGPEQEQEVCRRFSLHRANSVRQMMVDYGVSMSVIYDTLRRGLE